jgi:hypothetical protein
MNQEQTSMHLAMLVWAAFKDKVEQILTDLPLKLNVTKPPWIATGKEEKRDETGMTRISRERERVQKVLHCGDESSKDGQGGVAVRTMILKGWQETTKQWHTSSSGR